MRIEEQFATIQDAERAKPNLSYLTILIGLQIESLISLIRVWARGEQWSTD